MKHITRLFTRLATIAVLGVFSIASAWAGEGDTHDFAQTLQQLLNNNASISSINISAQSYTVKKVIVSYRYNKEMTNAVTVTVSVGGQSWGSKYIVATGSNYSTLEFTGESNPGAIAVSFTNNTGNGTGHGTFYVNNVQLVEGTSITTYNVSFNAGSGTFVGNDDFPNASNSKVAGTYTLPSATPAFGYAFDGWVTTGSSTPMTGSYTVSGDVAFTAQYSEVSSVTATLTQSNLELSGSYTSGTTKTIDGITYVFTDLMKNNENIQAKASTGTIKNTTPYHGDIISVDITHFGTARETTINGSADGSHWTQVATGTGSVSANFEGKGYRYFQITRGANAAYWTKVEITYSSSTEATPSIIAEDVDIQYNATSGSITYTIANEPSPAGTLTASTESEWLTLGTVGNTVPFTCAANEETTARTATVTLTYTYDTDKTVTSDVTVTQAAAPVIYNTIPALFNAATTTATVVNVTFNNWVVSGVATNGKNIFVTDNSGNGLILYFTSDQSASFAPGKILSGTAVECKLQLYGGSTELLEVDVDDLTITSGGTVSVSSIEMAELTGINTGAVVSYENLTCSVDDSKYYLTDGTTTLQVYNSLFAFDALESGKTYNITGVYQQYSSTKEILPRSANDIVEVVITTPSITVDPATVNTAAEMADGTLNITYENLDISDMTDFDIQFYNAAGEETAAPSWIEVLVAEQDPNEGEGYVVSYVAEANTGAARTAYFKVYALDSNVDCVYSNLVTINQAEYIAPGTWELTTLADLTPSDVFVIVSVDAIGTAYAMANNDGTSNPSAVGVTIVGNTLSGVIPDNLKWNIGGNATDGYVFYPSGTTETWLYCLTGSSNSRVRVGTNENSAFFLDPVTGYLHYGDYYIGVYNEQDWRGYKKNAEGEIATNIAGQTFAFYKKVVPADTPTSVTLNATFGDGCYWATYFNADAQYVLSEGAQAFTMDENNNLYRVGTDGTVIPENTAVVIISDTETVTLTLNSQASASIHGDNILQGSNVPVAVTAGTPYVLGKVSNKIGFYEFTGTNIPANKAYYVVNE